MIIIKRILRDTIIQSWKLPFNAETRFKHGLRTKIPHIRLSPEPQLRQAHGITRITHSHPNK